MITLVEYTGLEPMTLDEVKLHCRIDEEADDQLIVDAIIPAARALAEAKTGAVIRQGRFTEKLMLGSPLSVGQVSAVESVLVDGVSVAFEINQRGRRTVVISSGHEGKLANVTFVAGIDILQFPGVKNWLLMTASWMYSNRELMRAGTAGFNEMPQGYVDALLAPISVPASF